MSKFLQAVGLVFFGLAIFFALAMLFAFPTKWLVNYIYSDDFRVALFGVSKIGFWRALAINYFVMSLFKGTSK